MFKDMEVIKLMAHLLITVLLILGYVVLVYIKGFSDETLKSAILLAVGYWFGAVRMNSNKKDSSGSGSNE
jgi:hypothetical protein